jgi:flagellar hook-associated protein 1 FlgK
LSIAQFWNATTSKAAQASAAQSAVADGLGSFRDALAAQREQQSGVNLDEELILILQFQHSYQAAARIISTIEQLMNTLLNI